MFTKSLQKKKWNLSSFAEKSKDYTSHIDNDQDLKSIFYFNSHIQCIFLYTRRLLCTRKGVLFTKGLHK